MPPSPVAESLENAELAAPTIALMESARERFRDFFKELNQRFVEREDVIEQVALALLAKQHVLLTGPPGTAKSALAKTVLQNIVDRDSGAPSVFARQFTESTVQTDLIGPLDFKTLMESGRTEHFTEEGMLGAAHAFLDEVLDGRDMLLRATLNVLHERELKQGTKTTKGAIECALMTTNRYLSEVMEQSRETLLAFVDRIAFVAFVPKGFGKPDNLVTILERQMGPRSKAAMPQLTLQDVDVLQDLVDYVAFPDHVGKQLVSFLNRIEAELSDATRADPRFIPTRYISTRTVVRTAEIMKAACVYDWIMNDASRPLRVRRSDFQRLRLTLMLAGPALDTVPSLLERESDARERRQLSIFQTERHIFDAAVQTLAPDPPSAETPREALIALSELRTQGVEAQLASCEKLAAAASRGGVAAIEARHRLGEATDLLAHRALSRALRAGIADEERELSVRNLERLAELLEHAHPAAQELAPMLRTRALEVLEARLEVSLGTPAAAIRDAVGGNWKLQDSLRHSEQALERVESIWRLRSELIAGGAVVAERSEERWSGAVALLEEALVQIWEFGFDACLEGALVKAGGDDQLAGMLTAIDEPLESMRRCGRWFEPFGRDESCIAAKVVGAKLMPFIERVFAKANYASRTEVAEGVEQLLQRLDDYQVHWAVSSEALITWAARVLLSVERRAEQTSQYEFNYEGYRSLRSDQSSVALCFALVEVCTHIALAAPELRSKHPPSVELIADQLGTLPRDVVQQIVEEDTRRISETLTFFSGWWQDRSSDGADAEARLRVILDSRFHALLDEESALVRFALEAQLMGALFPSAREVCEGLRAQLREFNESVNRDINGMLEKRSQQGWRRIVAIGEA